MNRKSIVSWALIFSFTLLLFQPLDQAKQIAQQISLQQSAILSGRLKTVEDAVADFKSKQNSRLIKKVRAKSNDELLLDASDSLPGNVAETDNASTSEDSTDDTTDTTAVSEVDEVDESKMAEVTIILNAPEKVMLGATAAIGIATYIRSDSDKTIDKINISIQESSGNVSFKDSFINIKNQTQFQFFYSWDTFLAQSKADKGEENHKIIVEAYQKINDQYVLFQNPITQNIKVVENNWGGITNDNFWNSYLEQNGGLNDTWLKKLGCANKDECKTRAQIQDHLADVISNSKTFGTAQTAAADGSFSYNDAEEINNGLVAFNRQVDGMKVEQNEESAKVFINLYAMTDLVSFIDEKVDEKVGYGTPEIPQDILTAPEMFSTFKALDKYQVKMASYDPQSKEELVKLPFWSDMEKEIRDNIQINSQNEIKSIDQLTSDESETSSGDVQSTESTSSTTTSLLRPEKASAIAPAAIALAVLYIAGLAIAGYDLYKAYHDPTNKRSKGWAWFWMAVAAIPPAALEKTVGWVGAKTLGPLFARFAPKLAFFTEVGARLTKIWEGLGWGAMEMAELPGVKGAIGKALWSSWSALTTVGKWIGLIPGFIKKNALTIGKTALGLLRFLGILKASPSFNSTCPGISLFGKGGIDPFAWALCNLEKFIFDLAYAIYKFSLCLLRNAVGSGLKSVQCKFDLGTP